MIWALRTKLSRGLEWLADVVVERSARFDEVSELLDERDLARAATLLESLRHEFGPTDRDVVYYSVILERLREGVPGNMSARVTFNPIPSGLGHDWTKR